MATTNLQRGEFWWVDWSPGRGSEQTGRRPALIVQTNPANHNPRYSNTVVVTVSTKGRNVPTHLQIEPNKANGLKATSFIKCEQLMTISKDRLEKRIGRLTDDQMEHAERSLIRVDKSLRTVLAL